MPANVPRLVTAYYTERPDSSGTEDIRKIRAESYRSANYLRRILQEARATVNYALAGTPDRSDRS
jgi:phosphoglucomutase